MSRTQGTPQSWESSHRKQESRVWRTLSCHTASQEPVPLPEGARPHRPPQCAVWPPSEACTGTSWQPFLCLCGVTAPPGPRAPGTVHGPHHVPQSAPGSTPGGLGEVAAGLRVRIDRVGFSGDNSPLCPVRVRPQPDLKNWHTRDCSEDLLVAASQAIFEQSCCLAWTRPKRNTTLPLKCVKNSHTEGRHSSVTR